MTAREPDPLIAALGRVLQREVDAEVKRWIDVAQPLEVATLEQQISHAVHAEDPAALTRLHAVPHGEDALLAAARLMAGHGAASVAAEAKRAGLDLPDGPPLNVVTLTDWASAVAAFLAASLALGMGREAFRLWRPGALPEVIIDGVRAYVGALTDRSVRDVVGGLLTRGMNLGRLAAYKLRPAEWEVDLIADETLDSNTCKPCREIDGVLLPSPEAAGLAYGGAGYLFCEGRDRCRGTVRGEWRRADEAERRRAAAEHLGLVRGLAELPYSITSSPDAGGREAR